MSDVDARTLRCASCGDADYDLIHAGKPWHASCALAIFGEQIEEIGRDLDAAPEDDSTRLAVVECGLCGGWMWAGLQDRCLGCGSFDLRAVALI